MSESHHDKQQETERLRGRITAARSKIRQAVANVCHKVSDRAVECWDNPTTANADCIYLERDLTHRLDRYNRDDDITAVNIWAESLGNGNYLIYIAYA